MSESRPEGRPSNYSLPGDNDICSTTATRAVSAERLLVNALVWGDPSADLVHTIDLAMVHDTYHRDVIATVMALTDDEQPVTLATVHAALVAAGVHHGDGDAWRLVMADATAAGGSVDEDAAAVYLERIRATHHRRRGRQILARAAHRLEGHADPEIVLAEAAKELGAA